MPGASDLIPDDALGPESAVGSPSADLIPDAALAVPTATAAAPTPMMGYRPATAYEASILKDHPQQGTIPGRNTELINAAGTGINSGGMDLLGLPMDALTGAANLPLAGVEAAMLAAGKTPPTWMDPVKPGNVPGTAEWLKARTRQLGGANLIDAQAQDPDAQALHTMGEVIGPSELAAGMGNALGPFTRVPKAASDANVTPELRAAAQAESSRMTGITEAGKSQGFNLPSPGSSRATLAEAASDNQPLVNQAIRSDLKLPSTAPVTHQMMEAVRAQPSPEVDQIKAISSIPFGKSYEAEIDAIKGSGGSLSSSLPGYKPAGDQRVTDLVDSLKPVNGMLSGEQSIALSRSLRSEAKDLFASAKVTGNPADLKLAQAHRDAAEAVENAVTAHLQGTGQGELADAWDARRTLMAKTYDVDNAMDAAGNVDATKLSRQLMKRGGKGMSGQMDLVANLAGQNPQAFKLSPENAPAGVGPVRRLAARAAPLAGAMAGGHLGGPLGAGVGEMAGDSLGRRILGQ